MNQAHTIFNNLPRRSLAPLKTPLEPCRALKSRFPELPNIYIKRDDFIGPMVWGNKLRKLEYTFATEEARQADVILTYGGIQSNHARITSQIARRLGYRCVLVLNGEPPVQPTGNFLLNQLHEVEIHYVDTRAERLPRMEEIAKQLKQEGQRTYCIPLGASDYVGSMGFVHAMQELKQQQEDCDVVFDALLHGTSSGGTQAGLEVGKRLFDSESIEIISISADDSREDIQGYVMAAITPMLKLLGMPGSVIAHDLTIETDFIGEGYAIPTPASKQAALEFARTEGILLDATYTGKVAAAIFSFARSGRFSPDQHIVFWHTGGTVNLFR